MADGSFLADLHLVLHPIEHQALTRFLLQGMRVR